MSKTTTKAKSPMAPSTKKTIIISVICAVMVIVLAVSLPLMLKKQVEDGSTTTPDTSTSQAYIKNGDFAYMDRETTYPKTADNWTKYTHASEGEGEDAKDIFEKIENEDKVVAGIVDTDEEVWNDVLSQLKDRGITATVSNPGIHTSEGDTDSDTKLDRNVFMFATKEATNAAIVSTSFSVPSQSSAKITVWVNTSLLTSGKATIAVQKYSSTKLSTAEEDRYAYEFGLEQKDGWQEVNFYVFNRKTSSQSVVVNVSIGNTYTGENAEGILFVDDVVFETITANDYRKFVDGENNANTRYGQIGADSNAEASEYATLTGYGKTVVNAPYTTTQYAEIAAADVEGEKYSPFTKNDNFTIYEISNNGTTKDPVALQLNQWNGSDIVVKSSEELKDHLHISFWIRTIGNNVLATANIVVQSKVDGEWEDLSSGSFTSVATSQDIREDSNCGWTKYDIYLKPTSARQTTVRVLFALGNVKGYASTSAFAPNGTLFVTSPFVEEVSSSDYDTASSGTYAKKISLVGDTASTSVSNGSFSNVTTSNAEQPSNWQPVFAGYNVIYKDGEGNIIPDGVSETGASGKVVRNSSSAPTFDDSEQNYLQLTNKTATSFGYLSNDLTLSAHTVYTFSVLVKTEGNASPFIYVVKNVGDGETRTDAVLAKVEGKAETTKDETDGKFGMVANSLDQNGWTRYYLVVITGDESVTARVALFNGSIDGTSTQQGTVCYDYVAMTTIGSYTIDTAEYEEGDEDAPATNRDRINFTTSSGYSVFEELTTAEITSLKEGNTNVAISAEPDWDAMVEAAMAEDEEDDDDEDTTTKSSVDVGLLLSVISSVALVGALLIVIVVRWFRKRNNQ